MFKKITLTTAFVASSQAKRLHMRDGDGSVPACTSLGCKTDSAVAGWDVPTEFTYGQGPDFVYGGALSQGDSTSVPACDSTGCKTTSVADGWNVPGDSPYVLGPESVYKKLAQHESIPACNTYGGCKTGSSVSSWNTPSLYTDYRGDPNHTYGTGYNSHVYGLNQRESVPACTSLGCKKGTASAGPDLYTDYRGDAKHTYGTGYNSHVYGLNQRQSIPACDSTGCKKATASSGWNVPTMSPEIYGNNGEYTYATNDHKFLS